jgi:hypothetical protein
LRGGGEFITIGNFKDDANTLVDSTSGTLMGAYFFIDDVSVIDCTVGIGEVNDYLSSGKLYPNPATKVVYFENNLSEKESGTLQLMDITGREMASYKLNKGSLLAIPTPYSRGVYLVKINITGKPTETVKLILE